MRSTTDPESGKVQIVPNDPPLAHLKVSDRLRHAIDDLNLTRRESELATLVSLGWNTVDICAQLGISSATMRTHLRNVYANLGITGRAQLVARVLHNVLARLRD